MTRRAIFAALKPFAPDRKFTEADVKAIDALADTWGFARDGAVVLTPRILAELIHHEAIVQEAYKDSVGVWTWSVGLAATGGFDVARYKDNPQTIATCLRAFVAAVGDKYLPDVVRAFGGRPLTEAQLGAALSFHYNTSAIERTDWVKLWIAGKPAQARTFLETHYLNGGDLKARRYAEAALFFDGKWGNDGTALVVPVGKPSYRPVFAKAKRMDIRAPLVEAMV